ncbi:endoribonuclease YbeY [Aureimonas endophytica]|uniref:Endoribonuclease YbeY n=1 Tax=Aureimonas endophytica TaxID=2027858 RepID=A0A917A178_9HYPH|nr:rRNA maturation RNase YbeY [Aureimonas endophytica]GGE21898.1 endoribonuclease YbeY [Aureimonas endophytica]
MSAPRAANDPGAAEPGFAGLALRLSVEDAGWDAAGLGDLETLVWRAVAAAAAGAGLPATVGTELGVTLADDAAVQALNAEWRGKDKPTNVLSFPIEDLMPGEGPGPMLGDLILARETVFREAALENKSPADHFCHLVVHGMLHCLGYDHEDEDEAEAMEALEVRILADLGIADPYAAIEV